MHFSKTYTQLLLSLPPELRDSAIQYRQLKKVINQIVSELSALGLDPQVLTGLIESGPHSKGTKLGVVVGGNATPSVHTSDVGSVADPMEHSSEHEQGCEEDEGDSLVCTEFHRDLPSDVDAVGGAGALEGGLGLGGAKCRAKGRPKTKVVYELKADDGLESIEPRLRIWVDAPDVGDLEKQGEVLRGRISTKEGDLDGDQSASRDESLSVDDSDSDQSEEKTEPWLDSLQKHLEVRAEDVATPGSSKEIVIPLVHDTEFYRLLLDALKVVSEHLSVVRANFVATLEQLARTIADSSRPASGAAKSFHPYSPVTTHAGTVKVNRADLQSDLYFWREIFQLYAEAEVFESMSEASRGEWNVEESEKRLKLFAERVVQQGLGDGSRLKLKQSRDALETFISLNMFILNIKKLSFANSEATRKILKKHAKRTGLTGEKANPEPLLALVGYSRSSSLPRTLVQVIGEVLLPIIPHVDDYSCLICMSIAFKPIRLSCAHLFCVRCLVKMQKRGKENCPLCRAPSVLIANRSNVDWALLNFMQDWFPYESREKMMQNEKEAAAEHARELGIDIDRPCTIM